MIANLFQIKVDFYLTLQLSTCSKTKLELLFQMHYARALYKAPSVFLLLSPPFNWPI